MSEAPLVLLDSCRSGSFASSWRFDGYVKTVAADCAGEVPEVLNQVELAAAAGFYAVGFVAYEAACALNPDLPSVPPVEGLPLAWFAIYQERRKVEAGAELAASGGNVALEPLKPVEQYVEDVERIRAYIAAGDCYQVNHTFQLSGQFSGEPTAFYHKIARGQRAPFSAYLDTGRFAILSASPELFFSLDDGVITTRPMKGTASRGRWSEEDTAAIEKLRQSHKERAENLMIVDLLRNDLGIVAETGSVSVDALFEIETYPTVHQMASTVSAKLRPGSALTDIFRALFPCGSVTGAPKRRSMEIISELEKEPRGIYCGAVGYVAPGGEALFSVAIRTLLYDKETSRMTMGIGSAVTWDSTAASEYAECLSKSEFVTAQNHDFRLIESLRLEHGRYTLLDRHLARLKASAGYFGFACYPDIIRLKLSQFSAQQSGIIKVRLLLSVDGSIDISADALTDCNAALRTAVSDSTVESSDALRYHKTTRRDLFDKARAERPECDELLFLNERGELTEGSYHNLVVKLDGQLLTPPLGCGLLPGVLREELLERGKISERILLPADLKRAEELWLINSVRGWRRCVLATDGE